MAELTAPFVYKNDEKRIVYGPVLIPDEPDTDDDVVTAEQIENVAHKFVEDYGNIDLMHSLNNVGRLVESYISPVDLEIDKDTVVPKGSWLMGVRVTDEESWQAVKDNKLGGFSIMALQKAAMKSAAKDDDSESKRVTLADLGDDWIVNAVSLVDEPAVPKAKFLAIKSKKKTNDDNDVVEKAIEGSLEHRRQLLDQKLISIFAEREIYPIIHSTMSDSVIFIINDDDGNDGTFQVDYKLDDDGNIEFTSEPQEVKIEENVVGANGSNDEGSTDDELDEDDETDEGDELDKSSKSNQDNSQGFMSKFMKSIGVGSKATEKAGKIISSSNLKKLKAAKEAIDDMIAIGEKERERSKSKKEADEMKEEEVKELIEERLEPLESKLDDIIEVLQDDKEDDDDKEENEEEEADKSEKGEGDNDDNEESSTKSKKNEQEENYKEMYESVLKQLKNKPFSHRLSGQDGAEKSKEDDNEDTGGRNAFGFKRK